ncbi:MAG: class I SAM-dependent methyltransferase [Verrucomicrobiales bacterium]|nr:class I SAM-dependent methyltransferase [Verrucomicrobiales bacterium]
MMSVLQNLLPSPVREASIKARIALYRPFGWLRGRKVGANLQPMRAAHGGGGGEPVVDNALWTYFQNNHTGPGIWKWHHYFEAYDRHLAKFRGQSPVVMEVGIYSGGSLGMWRSYFGPGCSIIGVDIEEACRVCESEGIRVLIGDQGDPEFWRGVKKDLPPVDVFIDDGGHTKTQQIVTLEQMLSQMAPGGVFICEDIHGTRNGFMAFVAGMAGLLNKTEKRDGGQVPDEVQRQIHSIHIYPYMVVVEKRSAPLDALTLSKQGTEWQPFLHPERMQAQQVDPN